MEHTNPEEDRFRQPEKERLRQPEKRFMEQAAKEVATLKKKHGISMLVEPLILGKEADDVMLGMLYVFRKLPQKSPQAVCTFRESILELCDSHTNQVSSAYLKAIIQGAYFERMEQVWNGLCGTEQLDISKLTQVGNNSGTEMLLGMLIALRICLIVT